MKTIVTSEMTRAALERLVYESLTIINENVTSVEHEDLGNLMQIIDGSFHDDDLVITTALVESVRARWIQDHHEDEESNQKAQELPVEPTLVPMQKTYFGDPGNAVHGFMGVVNDTNEYARVEVVLFYVNADVECYEVSLTRPRVETYTLFERLPDDLTEAGFYTSIGHTEYHRGWASVASGGRANIADELRTRFNIEMDFSRV